MVLHLSWRLGLPEEHLKKFDSTGILSTEILISLVYEWRLDIKIFKTSPHHSNDNPRLRTTDLIVFSRENRYFSEAGCTHLGIQQCLTETGELATFNLLLLPKPLPFSSLLKIIHLSFYHRLLPSSNRDTKEPPIIFSRSNTLLTTQQWLEPSIGSSGHVTFYLLGLWNWDQEQDCWSQLPAGPLIGEDRIWEAVYSTLGTRSRERLKTQWLGHRKGSRDCKWRESIIRSTCGGQPLPSLGSVPFSIPSFRETSLFLIHHLHFSLSLLKLGLALASTKNVLINPVTLLPLILISTLVPMWGHHETHT